MDDDDLSAEETRQCALMREHIGAAIDSAGGWLSFERYMELALYAPGLGYYSGGARKFGTGGDFTTAPEISGLFGACIARQCAAVLARLDGGCVLEIGAGTGRLAADVLARLDDLGKLPARYWILEVSADLRARQREMLQGLKPTLRDRVEWLDTPPTRQFDGVIFANEVLDALPVARFRRDASGFAELGVAIAQRAGAAAAPRFAWAARPASAAMSAACGALAAAARANWADGYASEYCPRLSAWTAAVTRALKTGAVLWFDYGLPRAHYYFPERRDGTLLCHFRQRVDTDPFRHPGLQDITAWVEFTALAEAGKSAGFHVAGYTTQTYFLAGNGIDREMQDRAGADRNQLAYLAGEARQLMLPGEMGERFKAMAWLRGLDLELAGFALRDLRHTL